MENENVAQKAVKPQRSKKADYIAAIVVNALMLIVVNQILNWGILPFLTQDFKQVLPIQNAQLIAVIAVNLLFLFYDSQWFVSILRIVTNSLGIAVVLRFMSVFPFDLSAYGGFNWAVLARVLFIIGIVGCAIAIVVDAFKLLRALMKGK